MLFLVLEVGSSLVKLEAVHRETRETSLQFLLTLATVSIAIPSYRSPSRADFSLNITCHHLSGGEIPFILTMRSPLQILISMTVDTPGYVLCRAKLRRSDGSLIGVAAAVSRRTSDLIGVEIHQPRYVDGNTGEETDQNIIIRVDFDQELLSCDPSFFHVIGLSLMKAYASEKSYFRTSCEVVLRSSFSGWKTLFLGKYSVSSLGGGWNDAEVRIDFLYQRNRPSVLLWDATPAGIHVYRRSLVCVFSHDVELVSVGVDGRGEVESINVGCENCLVVATNMLTKRLLTLELLANRRIGRSRHRSSRVDPSLVIQFVVPEGIAEDALGMGNVRSTPISESFDSKSFSLSLWSPLTPLTRNSSILFELLTSEPLFQVKPEDFVVKNGYILSLTQTPIVEANTTTGETTYRYPFLVKATVQGQVCVDILKSVSFSLLSRRHVLQSDLSPAQPDLALLLHHSRYSHVLSLTARLSSARPSPRDAFSGHHDDLYALVHLSVLGAHSPPPLFPPPPRPHPSLLRRPPPLPPLLRPRTDPLHLRHQRRGPARLRRLRRPLPPPPRGKPRKTLPHHPQRPPHRPRRQPSREQSLRIHHRRRSAASPPQRLARPPFLHDRSCRATPSQSSRGDGRSTSLRASSPRR